MARAAVVALLLACGRDGGARAASVGTAGRRLQGLRGHPDCPCVNPWGSLGGIPPDLTYVDLATGAGCLKYVPPNGTQRLCYPLDYGASECRAWDKNLPPLCAEAGTGMPFASAGKSCGDLWCFVNGSRCTPSPSATSSFPMVPELFYSYETCGNINNFASELLVKSLSGRVMRVGIPTADGEWPLLTMDEATGVPGGISTDFLRVLADRGEFQLSFQDISEDSRAVFPQSSYSACVRDVALRRLDFCTGFFWDTPDRRAMTTYAPPYYPDIIYLVVFTDQGRSLFEMLTKVFDPFSPFLWLVIIAFSLAVGMAMWALGEVGDMPPLRGSFKGVRMALLQLFGQGGFAEVESRAGHIVLFGFGFMCMVALASYTANLSSFLLIKNVKTGITGIPDAVAQSKKICVPQAIQHLFLTKFPDARGLVVEVDVIVAGIEKMDTNECDVALLSEREYQRMHAGIQEYGRKTHCNKAKVENVALSVDMGMPIQRDIEQAVGYLMVQAKAEGVLDNLSEKYPLPRTQCTSQGQGLEEEVQAMNPSDLTGVLIITSVTLASGLLVHVVDRRAHRAALTASAADAQAPQAASMSSLDLFRARSSTPGSACTPGSRVAPMAGSFNAKTAIRTISRQADALTNAVELLQMDSAALREDNAALRADVAALRADAAATRQALARLAPPLPLGQEGPTYSGPEECRDAAAKPGGAEVPAQFTWQQYYGDWRT